MSRRYKSWARAFTLAVSTGLMAAPATPFLTAQSDSGERMFEQSKAVMETALKSMQPNLAGRLPVLEGFAAAEHLDRYARGYYQASVVVAEVPGGSRVRVSAKITAWYADPASARSGYRLLPSNGRLEADLLDQLAEQVASGIPAAEKERPAVAAGNPPAPKETPGADVPPVSSKTNFTTNWDQSPEMQAHTMPRPSAESSGEKSDAALQSEVNALEEILRNQSHPKNLVAVKKLGTPVVATPSLNAKQLFLASMHDEFEMLDFNQDWVHVRISGLSRGWIWRNSLEMPEGIPDTAAHSGPPPAADLFHVIREETAQFPGDWQALRGKNVNIISVQKVDENARDVGSQERLEYAKLLLEKSYSEMTQKPQQAAGVVLIFDSADGGMIAATLVTLQQWKAGALSDAALWHNCFFDPPETFSSAGSSGTP